MKRYNEKQEAIRRLYEYEEENDVPEERRLTRDAYADVPEVKEASPRKKPYVDIRDVESRVRNLT